MDIRDFLEKKKKICVVGLGYVGLPLAVLLARKFAVIGFDVNSQKIEKLKKGVDCTGQVSCQELQAQEQLDFTDDEQKIRECQVVIVAVPTPIDKLKDPDLTFVKKASEIVGRNLRPGTIVVYESTVWPGLTEEICVPILEKESGLTWKKDFFVGYSPERVNPGDNKHTIENIVKVVAGDTPETGHFLAQLYGSVIKAGIYLAPNIKTAEAAKVIENIQRDLNIALMNELSLIFHRLNIDTLEVLKAARTKWNFLWFEPGLVGGHCISVDPYYLAYKAKESGYIPQLILAGRSINEYIPKFVAEETVKLLIKGDKKIKGAKVLILGFAFKENVPDARNTKVYDIIRVLREFEIEPIVYDPVVNKDEIFEEYDITLVENFWDFKPYDAIICAVKHNIFKEKINLNLLKSLSNHPLILIDVKGMYDNEIKKVDDIIYWRL